jgi:transcriptional regulator with XRE-family HTH domain
MAHEERTEETRAVGRRIHDARVRAGYSRQQFAGLMGWPPKQISRYEMGFKIADYRLARIGWKLGVSYDYLRAGTGPVEEPDVQRRAWILTHLAPFW